MDWTRARLLLILTFSAVNLVLGYQLWTVANPGRQIATQLAPHQVREARARLLDQGFDLLAQVPTQRPALPLLRVAPPSPQVRQELTTLFNRLEATRTRTGSQADPGVVYEISDGAIRYEPREPLPFTGAAENPHRLQQSADAFLERSGLLRLSPIRWVGIEPNVDGTRRVQYVPVYKGLPLFGGGVRLVLGARGWEEMSAYLPTILEEKRDAKVVLAATEALLRLAGHLQMDATLLPAPPVGTNVQLAVTQVDLGYYAGHPGQARAWDMVPTWRIQLGSGAAYYVNAYTGELERP